MTETREVTPLPSALRSLRPGMHDGVHVHRLLHLAAAKIEDLEERVASLSAALAEDATGRTRTRRPRATSVR